MDLEAFLIQIKKKKASSGSLAEPLWHMHRRMDQTNPCFLRVKTIIGGSTVEESSSFPQVVFNRLLALVGSISTFHRLAGTPSCRELLLGRIQIGRCSTLRMEDESKGSLIWDGR